jgi:hypothetical protein
MVDVVGSESRQAAARQIGYVSEMQVRLRLARLGIPVSTPDQEGLKYDLVAEVGGRLYRVQVKTAHRTRTGAGTTCTGTVRFHTKSVNRDANQKTCYHSYVGHADIFMVYSPDTDEVYVIPVDICDKNLTSIRVDPTSWTKTPWRAEDCILSAWLARAIPPQELEGQMSFALAA